MKAKKRMYQQVQVAQREGKWFVLLDDAPVLTPAKNPMRIVSEALAIAVAREWETETIHPDTMPLTRLHAIALDVVPAQREVLLADMVRYGETDLLCYRSPEIDLAMLQLKHFEPVLGWVFDAHGMVFEITDTAQPIAQPEKSLAILRSQMEKANDFELAALAMATPILGSALLTLAIWRGALDSEAAIAAARIDETYQAMRYGEDPETEAHWHAKARDIAACEKMLRNQ